MTDTDQVAAKISEIKEEMKRTGLWRKQVPAWVNEYHARSISKEPDFAGWLQFVYLPNLAQQEDLNYTEQVKYIVPQAMKFFGEDVRKGKLLQLLVELDSLS